MGGGDDALVKSLNGGYEITVGGGGGGFGGGNETEVRRGEKRCS